MHEQADLVELLTIHYTTLDCLLETAYNGSFKVSMQPVVQTSCASAITKALTDAWLFSWAALLSFFMVMQPSEY